MTDSFGVYIDGKWKDSETGDTFDVRNPANTKDIVATYQQGGNKDAELAIEAANKAQSDWARTPAPSRGEILHRTGELLADRKDELTHTLTKEEGKTLAEASPEVQRAIDIFRYYAQKARELGGVVKSSSGTKKNLYTQQEPMGVAGLITPWNYPIAIPAWKIAPALAAGNTVVLKPATQAPGVSRTIFECLNEAGIPDGVANYVTGPGSDIGQTLSTHEDVDVISFTGSTTVGNQVYGDATDAGKRAQCEMGGKNPTIVMPSADLDNAVEIVGSGTFGVTGQACTATSRAIVHENIYDDFKEAIVEYAENIDIGAGLEEPDMGPQVSESELESTLDYIDIGKDEGATLETGGKQIIDGEHSDGYFVEPTIFSAESDMRIAQEEVFGPVLSLLRVSDFDESVQVANDIQYGLAASIVTKDLQEANQFVEDIEAGVAKVNEQTTGLELHVPFGGYKNSSTNTYREQGDAGLDFFTTTKTVYMNF